MLNLKPKAHNGPYKVEVTDQDGNKEVFNSVEETAKALEVALSTIRVSLCYNKKVRGCTLKRVS